MNRIAFLTAFLSTIIVAADLELKISINAGAREVLDGDAVEMSVELLNSGRNNLMLEPINPRQFLIEISNGERRIEKTNFGQSFFAKNRKDLGPHPSEIILPGESLKQSIPLSRTFDLTSEGLYKIKVTYDDLRDGPRAQAQSSFVIVSRDEALRRESKVNRSRERRAEREQTFPGQPISVETPFIEPDKESPHVIALTSSIERFSLGSSPIRIAYANKSETDKWLTLKPDTAAKIDICVSNAGKTQMCRMNEVFSMVIRKNLSKIFVGPREQPVQIQPGTFFEFALDLYSIPMDWQPGVYELWIRDEKEKLGSNKLKFRLEADTNTVAILTRMAVQETDAKSAIENHNREIRRNFALNWLAKTFDDLKVNPITDRDNQAVLDAKMEQNRFFIDEFMAKWPTRKDSAEIKTLFQVLNSSVQTKPPSIVPAQPPASQKPVKPPTAPAP